MTVPLLVLTGLAEGAGLFWMVAAWQFSSGALVALFGVLVLMRWLLWRAWRASIAGAPAPALAAIDRAGIAVQWLGGAAPLALILAASFAAAQGPWSAALLTAAGVAVAVTGAVLQVHADHARRVLPGLFPGAAAGARRAPLNSHSHRTRRSPWVPSRQRKPGFAPAISTAASCTGRWRRCRASGWRSCSSNGCAPCCRTRTTTCPSCASACRPGACGPRTSGRWTMSRSCPSPSRRTCATTIPSACSRGPRASWPGCTPRRARPASPPWSATRTRTSTTGPT